MLKEERNAPQHIEDERSSVDLQQRVPLQLARDTRVASLDVEISLISSGTKGLPHEGMVSTKQTATANTNVQKVVHLLVSSFKLVHFARHIRKHFYDIFQISVDRS